MAGSKMSTQAQQDMVEVGDEWPGLKGCSWGVRQAIGLEVTWWRQETSSWAQKGLVEVGDQGWGGR